MSKDKSVKGFPLDIKTIGSVTLFIWLVEVEALIKQNPEVNRDEHFGACPYTVGEIIEEAARRVIDGWNV